MTQKTRRVRSTPQIERTCLSHLDDSANWKHLRAERPAESSLLSWKTVLPIFRINMLLFSVILSAIFVGLEIGPGGGMSSLREDFTFGLVAIALISLGLSLYVMSLYRKSWNRRAKRILEEETQAS